MGPVTVLSSDSHVFEPPDLWTKRIDAAFRDRAPRMERVDGADEIVVEQGQVLSGIGLLSNTGVRFEAPEIDLRPSALRGRPSGRLRPRPAPARHAARRGGRRSALPFAGPVLLPGCRPGAHVGDLSRLQTIISTFETLPSKDIETLPVPVELTGGYCWRTPLRRDNSQHTPGNPDRIRRTS